MKTKLFVPYSILEFKQVMKNLGQKVSRTDTGLFLVTKKQIDLYHENQPLRLTSTPKIEAITKPISDTDFARHHRAYLESRKDNKSKAVFEGKYVLICYSETRNNKTTQPKLEAAKGLKAIVLLKKRHTDHKYVLVHQSRARKHGIKRNHKIWRSIK